MLDADQIARLIPHAGSMCLLNAVTRYDQTTIHCVAVSHRLPGNPLRENGSLHAVCGVEYAAQAMAVHGALMTGLGQSTPRSGRLAGVRSLHLNVETLDDIEADLEISAVQLLGDENSMVYEFAIDVPAGNVLKGRATVVLMPAHSESS
jgi:predicted hotdog family 3-hydroxylacyl-ACP dehydratase